MSAANRLGDYIVDTNGQPMVTACRIGRRGAQPRCAYCEAESTRACDAPEPGPRQGRWGRCWRPMCTAHTTRIGEDHDLCREHAGGDQGATLRTGDTSHHVWWERVETKSAPIPGTERPPEARDRIPGVIDPDDEQAGAG